MQPKTLKLDDYKQNDKLPIWVVSPSFGCLSNTGANPIDLPHRSPYYFIRFMIKGSTRHGVDLEEYEINSNQ